MCPLPAISIVTSNQVLDHTIRIFCNALDCLRHNLTYTPMLLAVSGKVVAASASLVLDSPVIFSWLGIQKVRTLEAATNITRRGAHFRQDGTPI